MALLRHLIETGAWWDVVDDIATHLVRTVFVDSPEVEGLRLREWSVDEHLWVRRTAIIAQVGAGEHTDPAWVRAFVTAHDSELSGLSRREALRHLG